MNGTSKPSEVVVVTGDVTMDWNLVRSHKPEPGCATWREWSSRMCWQWGGAALLADIVEKVADGLRTHKAIKVRQTNAPRARPEDPPPIFPNDHRFSHGYTTWLPYKFSADPKEKDLPSSWRIDEYLGMDPTPELAAPGEWARVVNDTADAGLVIIDDANRYFHEDRSLWPISVTEQNCRPWVLLKMARGIAQGALWHHLYKHHADRLIVVMTANDLRLREVQISRELSWERTAQDLAWEIVYNPAIAGFKDCAKVVVSFKAAGAFLYSRTGSLGESSSRLIFDPEVIEDMWERRHEGRVMGYTSCLTAGMARQWMLNPEKPDWEAGICSGLVAMRKLHQEGFGQRGAEAAKVRLSFPIPPVVAALEQNTTPFVGVNVPARTDGKFWTILDETSKENIKMVAQNVVLQGPVEALKQVPLCRFGNLLTVDRQEIESLRSIRSLVAEYAAQPHPERPLSIAVFGPPGSGKSFGITELANALLPGEIKKVEFNLSQFESTEELFSALHRVRDIGLGGKLPLVFWDEFDCSRGVIERAWLPHFLAPMQDGKFMQGGHEHPVGRAIFVFAGGICESLLEFGKDADTDDRKAQKVPDFISRLKGHLNVLGPNKHPEQSGVPEDKYYILRRALLLLSILKRNPAYPPPANIHLGVLRALLETRRYRHGARSMEAVFAMSRLAGKSHFERSSLPSEAQLDMHVDGQDFLALVQQLKFDPVLEGMARKAHELFCEDLSKQGFKYGPVTNYDIKEHSSLVDYEQLPEEEKEQNRDQVRQIRSKLAEVDYYMMPAREGAPPFTFTPEEVESLAAMEHVRWLRAKIDAGSRYNKLTNKAVGMHNCLLPWSKSDPPQPEPYRSAMGTEELPETEKEKDRQTARNIATILHSVGYTVVKAREK